MSERYGSRAPLYNPPFVVIGSIGTLGVLEPYFPNSPGNPIAVYTGDATTIQGPATPFRDLSSNPLNGINVFTSLFAASTDTGITPITTLPRGDLQGRQLVKASSHTTVYDGAFNRPADTTAYASGDVIGTDVTGLIQADQLTPEFAGQDNNVTDLHYFQEYLISDVVITTSGASTGLDFDLFIWSSTTDTNGAPVVGAVDNAPFDASVNGTSRIIGVLSFTAGSAIALGTGALWQAHGLGLVVPVVVNDTVITAASVWYTLVARSAYTPASQQAFNVKFGALS